jgi:hypothetical protein
MSTRRSLVVWTFTGTVSLNNLLWSISHANLWVGLFSILCLIGSVAIVTVLLGRDL